MRPLALLALLTGTVLISALSDTSDDTDTEPTDPPETPPEVETPDTGDETDTPETTDEDAGGLATDDVLRIDPRWLVANLGAGRNTDIAEGLSLPEDPDGAGDDVDFTYTADKTGDMLTRTLRLERVTGLTVGNIAFGVAP